MSDSWHLLTHALQISVKRGILSCVCNLAGVHEDEPINQINCSVISWWDGGQLTLVPDVLIWPSRVRSAMCWCNIWNRIYIYLSIFWFFKAKGMFQVYKLHVFINITYSLYFMISLFWWCNWNRSLLRFSLLSVDVFFLLSVILIWEIRFIICCVGKSWKFSTPGKSVVGYQMT